MPRKAGMDARILHTAMLTVYVMLGAMMCLAVAVAADCHPLYLPAGVLFFAGLAMLF